MVLDLAYVAVSAAVPSKYWLKIVAGIVIVLALRLYAQGRKTTRERDLHARVILITGAFTPLGLTLVRSLAQRGAHIIALSPEPITSPKVDILIPLLRSTTSNEQIFAEECDLSSAESIRAFCTRFLTSEESRLDAIVFAHEYSHIGPVFSTKSALSAEKERQTLSLATFLMTTLLLPVLLVAPSERDIRILNVVNPFYAAAVASFTPDSDPSDSKKSVFLQEGHRSLQTIVLTRHLQRILDSLPQGSLAPNTEENIVPVVNAKLQRSNIVCVSVSPGFSRSDTIARLLGADWTDHSRFSWTGIICYILLQPLLRIFTRSSEFSIQTILHSLFLPTPFKSVGRTGPGQDELAVEVLKPGSLYADCSVVKLNLKPIIENETDVKEKGREKKADADALPDDGEFGGEALGRRIWEKFEQALKVWEEASSTKGESVEVTEKDTKGAEETKSG